MRPLFASFGFAIFICVCSATTREVWGFSLLDQENGSLGEWRGGVSSGYEFEDQQTQGDGGPSSDVTRNRFDEDVQLRNEGFYIIDPRLIEGSAGVNLDFFQEQDKATGTNGGNQDGTLIGYDFSSVLLGQKPYTATLSTNRNENEASTLFGGRTHSVNQNFGLTASLREYSFLRQVLPYFSSTIDAREEQSDESTTQLGQTFKLNETRDVLGYEADKGFETADLDFYYQYISDRYTGTNSFSFSTQWANLNYSVDFGANLNRRFDSRISYYKSSGAFSQSFLYADERLHIDHFQNLSTTYEYLLSRVEADGQSDTSHTGLLQIEHHLYRSLVTTLSLSGYYETLTQGQRDYYAAELTPDYSRSIPWGGTLYLDGDGRYEIDDDHLGGSQVPVIDEQHTATPNGFTISNAFVVASSIVVLDLRAGRVLAQIDRDYEVIPEGTLTEIIPVPTSPLIQPGDPLQISYSYQVATNGRYSTRTIVADAGVTFNWLDLNFQHQQTDENMISGHGGQFLYNLQQDQARVDVHREWESFDARVNGLWQAYDSHSALFTLKYLLQNYGEYFTVRPGWSLVLRFNADQMFTNYTSPKRDTQSRDFEVTLDRFFGPGNYFSLYGRLRTITDSEFPTQDYLEAGLRSHFEWGKIHFEPIFSWTRTKYGSLQTDDPHLVLRIGRYL